MLMSHQHGNVPPTCYLLTHLHKSGGLEAMSHDPSTSELDAFHEGLATMAPIGVFLPFSEVVTLAGRCGWTEERLLIAVESYKLLGALETDPSNAPETCRPVRVRLLPDPERGVLCVSSEEETNAIDSLPVLPKSRRWKAGVLSPAPGSEMEVPLPTDFDAADSDLIPVFFRMYLQHKLEDDSTASGIGLDIPAWAVHLFENGVPWSEESIASLTADIAQQKRSLVADEESDPVVDSESVSSAMPSGSVGRGVVRSTKWGRCARSGCGRAFHPVLGIRGPFLACNRKVCRNTRDLTVGVACLQFKESTV